MATIFVFFFLFLLAGEGRVRSSSEFNRNNFPHRFVFGTSSSAYQYEGAWREDGKGLSVSDTFIHNRADLIYDGSNGDVALDSYHRYKEDVALMKNMNMDAYKFSISWSRVLPTGNLRGGINRESIKHYNNLINELLSKGVQPYVTLFHWDVPQGLEDEYLSFLSPRIVDDFRDYADVCFKEFGDRVMHWITLNEPWTFTLNAYATGTLGPGRCSPFQYGNCSTGDSSREPYRASHHMILAHAAVVQLYRDKYQASQKGQIGITLNTHWFVPYSNAKVDRDATARSLDFMFGFYMDPLTQGDYPLNMRKIVGDRLPRFNSTESEMVKGSFDFIGLNYYTTYYAKSISLFTVRNVSFDTDTYSSESGYRDGIPIGPQGASEWLFSYPPGIRDILHYIKNKYNNPIIYITENGIDDSNNTTLPVEEALKDDYRIDYHREHLLFVNRAIKEGVDVRGYFVWSLLDNFEWNEGYTVRFGINYVDFKNDLKRYPKNSALWFRKFLQRRRKSHKESVHILSFLS